MIIDLKGTYFLRTDGVRELSDGSFEPSTEVLRLCRYTLASHLPRRLVVQVTSGPDVGDDLVGLYALDGDQLSLGNAEWDLAEKAPQEVIDDLLTNWACGSAIVELVRP